MSGLPPALDTLCEPFLCNAGVAGDTAAASSSSCTSSGGGWAVDGAGVGLWLRQELPQRVLYLSSADTDAQKNQQVWLSPMLGVMSLRYLRHMACVDAQLAQPALALVARLADEWRHREFTDVLMLLLRLQLLSVEAALVPDGRTSVRLSELLPGELPHEFQGILVELPSTSMRVTPVPVVMKQLSAFKCHQLCTNASYDGDFVFVGPGTSGPDGWVVLQLVGGGRLVVVVQGEERATGTSRQTKEVEVAVEADKCWDVLLQLLLGLVTSNQTGDLRGPIIVGPHAHWQFYAQAGAFLNACMVA